MIAEHFYTGYGFLSQSINRLLFRFTSRNQRRIVNGSRAQYSPTTQAKFRKPHNNDKREKNVFKQIEWEPTNAVHSRSTKIV